jgi:hypothetical protein
LIRIWDGFLSLLSAIATAVIVGVPTYGGFLALQSEMIPVWGWGPLALHFVIGGLMVVAFLRKVINGIHPMRDDPRRRR